MYTQKLSKKSVRKFFFLLVIIFIGQYVSAQRTDTLLAMYNNKYPVERIHLQFDKSSYAPQDTVWFKAYLATGIAPDTFSKTLYVDFSDEKGKVWAHEAFPVFKTGTTFGQFAIPDSIRGNLVHVRAYTKWMLNFDSVYFYNKNLTVIQPRLKRIKGNPPASKPVLYFFPEGGDAIAGLKTRVAFLCEDQYGQPVNISGVVKDSKGNEIADLKTEHDGMGSFYFLPGEQEKYTAIWKDDKGNQQTTSLPDAKPAGVSLSIRPEKGQDVFVVSRQQNASDNFKTMHIVATMYQEVVYMANINLTDRTEIQSAIPVADLPSGIMQITVFDNSRKPLAERIVFIKNAGDIFQAEAGFSKLNFDARGKNELAINVPDNIPADLSVAVTDASLPADSSNNILSDLFLSSQIKGRVNNPYYYFTDTSDLINQYLDLVMLTHGWRRFNWSDVQNQTALPVQYPPDTAYLTFGGKIYGATAAQLTAAGSMLAIITSKSDTSLKQPLIVTINPDGTFSSPNSMYLDSLNVYYKFAGKKDFLKNAVVNFMPDRLPSPGKVPMDANDIARAALYDTSGVAAGQSLYDRYWAATHFDKDKQLADVTVQAKAKTKEEKLDEEYTSGLFQGGDARIFDIEDDPSAAGQMNVLAYLQGRVAGLQINSPMSPTPSLSWRGSTPALFVDEMPQQDASMIINLTMSDIAMVKVFPPPFIGAFGGGAGGAIAIYTKRGSDAQNNNDDRPRVPHKEIILYTAMRQFYAPNYLSLDQTFNKADVRQTLYWNPLILTDAQKHEVRLPFFNNDITHSFRIILEGMNLNGQLVHIEKVIQ